MPEMDGFQFVVEMQRNEAWRAIPIAVITAKDLTAEDRARLNGNVEAILQKGAYSRDELLAELRNLIAAGAGGWEPTALCRRGGAMPLPSQGGGRGVGRW